MIKARNALSAWKKVLRFIIKKGKKFEDQNGRNFIEVKNVIIKTEKSRIEKPLEVLRNLEKWIYPDLNEITEIILVDKNIPNYYYTYGKRIFNFNGKNQIEDYVIPLLKKYPNTRRAIIIIYDPSIDSSIERKETPGIIAIDFKIRNKKLYVTGIIRSNDMFFGWPANVYQLSVIQDWVANKLNISCGPIVTISLSAHIFEDQIQYIKKIL